MSLATRLTDLALARVLTWQQVQGLLDSAGADEQAAEELQRLLDGMERSGEPVGLGPATERDLAFVLYLVDAKTTLGFWDGASAEEAFLFDLRITRNRGDGSDIPGLPTTQLRAERELIALWSGRLSKWIERRQLQVDYELGERRSRGID